ncbi:adenylate kinase [Paraburkholderia humisilvae]|uniref:Adenylate kinase n=1 Tax=Paraburkholderia humisilvae TaxID=627669 RepID=A0A6J5E8H4_9BURK|nr:adenylate kinase [Paraburkholderia humisilvae]CAB3762147.1 hypothetical protein LMG29542_04254 [Paraburkholderia humisilvae]
MKADRTLVIGNSGSGKSWLAQRIADHFGMRCIDLDLIHWLPGGYNVAREPEEALRRVRHAAQAQRWVIEGIYGGLVNEVQTSATALVWLCLDEAVCVANIRERGIRRNGSVESFAALLQWRRAIGPEAGRVRTLRTKPFSIVSPVKKKSSTAALR